MNHQASPEPFGQKFGRLLVEQGKLTERDLERAIRLHSETAESVHFILTKLGLVTEADAAQVLASCLDLPLATEDDFPSVPILEDSVSTRFLKEHRVVPLRETDDGILLAMADPMDSYAVNAVELSTGRAVHPVVAVPADVENAFDRLYNAGRSSVDRIIDEPGIGDDAQTEQDIAKLRDLASEAPVIRLVNQLVSNATEVRASDIHIEPFERRLRIRYRIDGVLRDIDSPPQRLQAAVISRVKIMANLNIAERRLPQDGRIKLAVRGKEIDMRVSTVPTMYGESVVIRLLDRGHVALDFEQLGFVEPVLGRFRDIIHQPNGIVLVTGPTGSGKTTTLYAALTELNTTENKILTVEDPIEYQLDGINQVQVKPQIKLTFANALRSFLRQDPDIIMVGEIRDLETAEIAVQAALTGHLVLSTLHTNDAASTITRLLDMRVDDYLLTSTVAGVLAQRLVRRLCPDCRRPRSMPAGWDAELRRLADGGNQDLQLYSATGCKRCGQTGYRGRTTIMELFPVDSAARRLILDHAEGRELQRAAVEAGMATMYEDGLRKALAGVTTIEEVLRVTREG